MRKVALIYNSQNNKRKIVKIKKAVENYFSHSSYDLDVYETSYDFRCNDILNTTEASIYIICGGDGSINEVVNASHRNKKILYIPTGTVNDFAKTLKIHKNINKNLELIEKKSILAVDSGLVGGKYFNYVLATGPMTDVSYKTPSSLKKKLGRFAYFVYALISIKELLNHMHVELIVDDQKQNIECDFVFITNSNSVSGFNHIYKDISVNDGLFECLIVKRTNKVTQIFLGLKASMVGIEKVKSRHIIKFKTNHLKVNTDKNVQWIIDGEEGPKGSIEVEVIPKNLCVYTSRKELA